MIHAQETTERQAIRDRIEQLKARAEALSKGEFTSFTSDSCPLEVQEEFWRRVVAFEEGGTTTLAKVLRERGFKLPPPDQLTDEELTRKLWTLIIRLAELHCFLVHTDHLSDRDLYAHLVEESLQEEMNASVANLDAYSAYHFDLIGGGSDTDIQIMLRYYSTEEDREQWHWDFPDDVIPPMSIPPYDRDRLLPKWELEERRWAV